MAGKLDMMTQEEQVISVRQWCGWTRNKHNSFYWTGPNGESSAIVSIPDYANDLNAMWEAERGLSGENWANYFEWLQRNGMATGVRATAKQRLEGICRILWPERWKE